MTHEKISDAITEAAGRAAAAAMKIARLTNLTQTGALDTIHAEATRMLNNLNEARALKNVETGAPKENDGKRAPGHTTTQKVQ
jgi:hypothetical protein